MDIDMRFGLKEGIKHFFRQQEENINETIFNNYLFGAIEYQGYNFDTDYVTVRVQLNIEHAEDINQIHLYFEKRSCLLFADEENTFLKDLAKMIDIIYSNKPKEACQIIEKQIQEDKTYKNVRVFFE